MDYLSSVPISPEKSKCRTTAGDEEMTRCVEFYRRWKKDPNWCHKCQSAVSEIESYIDLVDGLEKRGVPQNISIEMLPEGVARPLFRIQDEEIKDKALSSISNALESGKNPITGRFADKPLDSTTIIQVIEKVTTGNVHFSSETEEWYTPPEIISSVVEVLKQIDIDPCSNGNTIPAGTHFTKKEDGLKQTWTGTVYMNPPYGGEIKDWIIKLLDEWESGNTIEAIALVPARTDTDWFYRIDAHPWCAIRGRLKFSNHKNSAPFPSAVFYLGSEGDIEGIERFFKVFSKHGTIFQRM